MKIEGTKSLKDQESAIQFKEAGGFELKTLKAGADKNNDADFERCAIGVCPDLFKLSIGSIPEGEESVWSGDIYIEGELKSAVAYRIPEE